MNSSQSNPKPPSHPGSGSGSSSGGSPSTSPPPPRQPDVSSNPQASSSSSSSVTNQAPPTQFTSGAPFDSPPLLPNQSHPRLTSDLSYSSSPSSHHFAPTPSLVSPSSNFLHPQHHPSPTPRMTPPPSSRSEHTLFSNSLIHPAPDHQPDHPIVLPSTRELKEDSSETILQLSITPTTTHPTSTPAPFLKPNTVPTFSSPLALTSKLDSHQFTPPSSHASPSILSILSPQAPSPATSLLTSTSTDKIAANLTISSGLRFQAAPHPDHTSLQKNDQDPGALDPKVDVHSNLSRASSSVWSKTSDEADSDQPARAPRAAQSSSSQSVGRKTGLNKSSAVPVMNRKDLVRMGSPLRHVTHLATGPALSPVENSETSSEPANNLADDATFQQPVSKSDLVDDLTAPQSILPSSSSALGLSASRSPLESSSPLISPTNHSVLFGSPTPRRKSALNPVASLHQCQFFPSSSPTISTMSASTSSASTRSTSQENAQTKHSGSLPPASARKILDSTSRRSSDPTKVPQVPPLIPQSHSRPIHHQSSPSLATRINTRPLSSRTSSPSSTKCVSPALFPHAHGHPSPPHHSPQHRVVQHSQKLSLTSPPAVHHQTTPRRNSLIFTPETGSSSASAKNHHHYNKSALSAALANNSSSAPPFPPIEAIKLTRVPTSVRVAQELRPSTLPYSHSPSSSLASITVLRTSTGSLNVCNPTPSDSSSPRDSGDVLADLASSRDLTSSSPQVYSMSPPNVSILPNAMSRATAIDQHFSSSPAGSARHSFSSQNNNFMPAPARDASLGDHEGSGSSGASIQEKNISHRGLGPSTHRELTSTSLASPITFTSTAGGSSHSGSHGSRGQSGSHFSPISYPFSPSSPYPVQRSLLQNQLVDQETQRNRSTSIFSALSEDNCYPAIGPSALPAARAIYATDSSRHSDELSMSPFSLVNASAIGSTRVSRMIASASGGCRTNPSSISVGTPNECSSSASSDKDHHSKPTLQAVVHPPKSTSGLSSTFLYDAPPSHQPLSRHVSSSLSSRRTALRNHRTSIAPGNGPSTEDFAKIIIQSRSAKIQKWKQQQQTYSKRLTGSPDSALAAPARDPIGSVPPVQWDGPIDSKPPFSSYSSSLGIAEGNLYKTKLLPPSALENNTVTGRTLAKNQPNYSEVVGERFLHPADRFCPERKRIPSFSTTPSSRKHDKEPSKSRIDEEEERRYTEPLGSPTPDHTALRHSISISSEDLTMTSGPRRSSSVRTIGAGGDLGEDKLDQTEAERFYSDSMRKSISSSLTVPHTKHEHVPSKMVVGPPVIREIEWVDWLDDYRRMKEAKLKAEGRDNLQNLTSLDVTIKSKSTEGLSHNNIDSTQPSQGPTITTVQDCKSYELDPASEKRTKPVSSCSDTSVLSELDPPSSGRISNFVLPEKPLLSPGLPSASSSSFQQDCNQPKKSNLSLLITKGLKSGGSSTGGSRRSVSRPSLTKQTTGSQVDLINTQPSSNTGLQNVPPIGKPKKNFTLGKKIDDWWNAVRTSFTLNAEDRGSSGNADGRLDPPAPNLVIAGSSKYAPRQPPSNEISLVSSFANLKSKHGGSEPAASAKVPLSANPLPIRPMDPLPNSIPTGALAPMSTHHNHPRSSDVPFVGHSPTQHGGLRISSDQRRRNPQLTLKLNRLSSAELLGISNHLNEPSSSHSSSQSCRSPSILQANVLPKPHNKDNLTQPIPVQTSSAPAKLPSTIAQSHESSFLVDVTRPEPTPVLSPTGKHLWDRTPGLVLGNPFHSIESVTSGNLPEARQDSRPLSSSAQRNSASKPTESTPASGVASTSDSLTLHYHVLSDSYAQTSKRNSDQQNDKSHVANTTAITTTTEKYQSSFSTHTIRQHIKHRLSTAKVVCDNSLRAIIVEITTYVEKEAQNLREQDRIQHELALVSDAIQGTPSGCWYSSFDHHIPTPDSQPPLGLDGVQLELNPDSMSLPMDRPLMTTTPACSPRQSLSRTLSIPADFSPVPVPAPSHLHRQRSISANPVEPTESSSLPASTNLSRGGSRHGRGPQSSGSISSVVLSANRGLRRASIVHRRGGVGSATTSHMARGLESPVRGGSRSVSISTQPSESVSALSRSPSRSRSPLPKAIGQVSSASHRRGSPRLDSTLLNIPSDEKFYASAFVAALQEISSVATEILDTSVGVLAAKSHACVDVIHRVQQIGKSWDDHDDWPHRGWYVRVLLAVAGLSRVLEWWDAEKGFWNFAPDDEDEAEEYFFFATRAEQPSTLSFSQAAVQSNTLIDVVGTPYVSTDGERLRIGTPQINNDSNNAGRLFDAFALPPPITDVTPALFEPGLNKSGYDRSFAQQPHFPLRKAQSVVSSGFELVHPQSAGLTNKPPSAVSHDLDQDFVKSIELARTETILVEVSLDNSVILYLSPGWTKVTGLDPQSVIGTPLGELIDGNYELFNEANRRLMEDVGNTVELQFTIKISLASSDQDQDSTATTDHFLPMTAKGMLMVDRVTGEGLHSMWVIRLNTPKTQVAPSDATVENKGSLHTRSHSDPVTSFPASAPLSTEPLLCRICEHYLPAYYFERHNETCAETHRLEMQVSEYNERLTELRDTIRDMRAALERNGSVNDLSYGDLQLETFAALPSSVLSPLNPSRASAALSSQHNTLRSNVKMILDEIGELLNVALDISTPSSNEEVLDQSIENLRLLSPNSENKLISVSKWSPRSYDDPALTNLAADVYTAANAKCSAVNRMRNTILYAERIRMEWEAKAQQAFMALPKRLGSEAAPLTSPIASEEIDRPRSAFQNLESDAPEVDQTLRRRLSTPSVLPSKPSPALRLLSINTKGNESKGLGISTSLPYSGLGTPPRSPHHPGLQSCHARRPSQPRHDGSLGPTPLSPRIPSAVPGKTKSATSIKDFDMLKPISKGAFGQVWLAKKKTTGDYYAIKILKKQDMIAKNQIMNVKSERKILMNQGDSDFVVKLFYTFSSRDHLYLVMEYLNGGDCAALVKALGNLPEEWTRNYVAEVVMGLEYLHSTGVVHRDLKPDNLLIDHRGHLKLTDFGLSKVGLLGRQAAEPRGPMSLSSSRDGPLDKRKLLNLNNTHNNNGIAQPSNPSSSITARTSTASTPDLSPMVANSYFSTYPTKSINLHESPSFGTPNSDSSKESDPALMRHSSKVTRNNPNSSLSNALLTGAGPASGHHRNKASDASHKHFVGTPDYLAPESILGIGMDEMVDWWALGVVCYEFLYGIPPFHDVTPDKVFDNILSRRLEWPESDDDISQEALDFMSRLMCTDPKKRLGAKGAAEVKAHPFLAHIDWANLFKNEASFVPSVTDPESTDYFDPRGATQVFHDDDELPSHPVTTTTATSPSGLPSQNISTAPSPIETKNSLVSNTASARSARNSDDFGTFNFKNLPVLERANEEVIRRLRVGQNSERLKYSRMPLNGKMTGMSSPTESTSSSVPIASRPLVPQLSPHARRPSEQFSRLISPGTIDDPSRRNSMPSRMRRASFSGTEVTPPLPPLPHPSDESMDSRSRTGSVVVAALGASSASSGPAPHRLAESWYPGSTISSPERTFKNISHPTIDSLPKALPSLRERTVDCLIAEDNPISSKVLETILIRFGCRCVVVPNGEDAISCAMGDIAFDVIFMDLMMPIIEGQDAARMIKSTQNPNALTPIVAVTSFESYLSEQGTLFAALLTKPVNKKDVLNVMKRLGFVARHTKC